MGNPFAMNSNSKNFASQKPWTFEVDGEKVEWRPEAPYLFPLTEGANSLITSVESMLEAILQTERNSSGGFMATPTGPFLVGDLSNRHTVLYLVNSVFGYEEDDDFEDEDHEPTLRVKYSKSAPKLVTIFGPQDQGIIY